MNFLAEPGDEYDDREEEEVSDEVDVEDPEDIADDGGGAPFAPALGDLRLLTSTSTVSRMTSPQEEATELELEVEDDSDLVREPSL